MKPTLKGIAEATGLSISTVSRILRGQAKRDSPNVEAVLEAAQALGYPLFNADIIETVKGSKTLFIGIVAHTHIGEFYSSFFDGFSLAAAESNAQVGLFSIEPDVEGVRDFLHLLAGKSYDGAVLFFPMFDRADLDFLLQNAPPGFAVISAATVYDPVLDTVSFDSYGGGHLVGKHFDEQGYTDVGVILGSPDRNESFLRKSGFTDYIEHHSDMKLVWQVAGDYTIESGRAAYEEYAQLKKKPRAIFVSNDYMCLGFMERARRDGVRIPEDVALVGYDDLPICKYHYPSISSVHTDYQTLGTTAISMVSEKCRNPLSEHKGVVSMVPVSLAVRDSS